MSVLDNQAKRRLRGIILRLVNENHQSQRHRLDDLTLHGALERLHFDLSRNQMRALLQDLGERGYLKFTEDKDADTGRVAIRAIQITPAGRDIDERTETNEAVEVDE